MTKLKKICNYLGEPYTISTIDGGPAVYRQLNAYYEIEVVVSSQISVYLWQCVPHRELMNIYTRIPDEQTLKDLLGYLSFKLENLRERIQVEREDLPL